MSIIALGFLKFKVSLLKGVCLSMLDLAPCLWGMANKTFFPAVSHSGLSERVVT